MHVETTIAKYTLTDLVLVKIVATTAVPNVPVIGEKVRGATVEQVPLRPYVLLQIGVLMAGEVLIGGSMVARAGIVQERSYTDISNICIINT